MRYVIFAPFAGNEGDAYMQTAPLPEATEKYLRDFIIPHLKEVDQDLYSDGFAAIHRSFARFSYVLDGETVLWSIEWDPGLLVVRFHPGGHFEAQAFRSPFPAFGGRKPLEEDLLAYDDAEPNHQYDLVFDSWDAQFEQYWRDYRGFKTASESEQHRFELAMEAANQLTEQAAATYESEATQVTRVNECKKRLEDWAGPGIRANTSHQDA